MKIVFVPVGKCAHIKEIKSGLDSLQHEVGGLIEAIYPFDDPVALVCNEEGKINGSEPNRALIDDNGKVVDIIFGDFFICGLGENDFCSLSDELAEKYKKYYAYPHAFAFTQNETKIIIFDADENEEV